MQKKIKLITQYFFMMLVARKSDKADCVMNKAGLISTNLAEKIALTITKLPHRTTAEIISQSCGQTISAQRVWNMMRHVINRQYDHTSRDPAIYQSSLWSKFGFVQFPFHNEKSAASLLRQKSASKKSPLPCAKQAHNPGLGML